MASLNIPFLVFSRSNFVFETNNSCYTGIITDTDIEENDTYEPEKEDSVLIISDLWGEAIFFNLDVDSRTVVQKNSLNSSLSKSFKSYFHMLLHPKLLLIPSISMKEKVGNLIDACVVTSPAKYIMSTSDHLWVTLHSDNVIRLWGMSDGRCLMWSPKELFLTKVKRVVPIPTYEGYLLCFAEEGDIYIVNIFRMRLLKHSSIDIQGIAHISLIEVDQSHVRYLITDDKGKITSWRIKTNKQDINIQTLWEEDDLEIELNKSRILHLPERNQDKFLLVFCPSENNQDLLMITTKEIMVKKFEGDVENIVVVEKFYIHEHILFATTIQKSEGIYVMIISDTYDLYIDRFDQLTENSAPLIQINIAEWSELNGKMVSSARLEELLKESTLKYDDNYKMLYIFLHDKKKLISWFINDMIRNSRYYIYGNNQDTFKPLCIPMQWCSIDIFSDQESVESEIFLHEGNISEIGHNLISFNDIIVEELK